MLCTFNIDQYMHGKFSVSLAFGPCVCICACLIPRNICLSVCVCVCVDRVSRQPKWTSNNIKVVSFSFALDVHLFYRYVYKCDENGPHPHKQTLTHTQIHSNAKALEISNFNEKKKKIKSCTTQIYSKNTFWMIKQTNGHSVKELTYRFSCEHTQGEIVQRNRIYVLNLFFFHREREIGIHKKKSKNHENIHKNETTIKKRNRVHVYIL